MTATAINPKEYIANLPDDRKKPVSQLRKAILDNLPQGFEEVMSSGMLGYVVPHRLYPNGYHCDAKQPLPFMCVASQKNFVALYHMGIYADKELLDWFTKEYSKQSKTKLDMGKSCIRFKKPDEIPLNLIGKLASKISVKQWIALYESYINKNE